MIGLSIKVIGQDVVAAKLAAAGPNILRQNRRLVNSMLQEVKPAVQAGTPLGPGHFGYHGRDTLKVAIDSKGSKTKGLLLGAVQLYWREYGTGMRYRGPRAAQRRIAATRAMTGANTGGEAPTMLAHKAYSATRRFISYYYGGMASWWHL